VNRTGPDVVLIPLTEQQRTAFVKESLADHADQQVRDAGWLQDEALDRARAELTGEFEREHAEAVRQGDRFWTAVDPVRGPVGWLWVKPYGRVSSKTAYLEQITVTRASRRRGYGGAMLAALEEALALDGVKELRLSVFLANEPALRLYAAADFESIGQDEHVCKLRKPLGPN
jgi:ribosomal protein S18 acetylase RimI-like enzyme